MANGGLLKELQELQPAPGATTTLPPRDVRARRPFLLRAIIRLRTLRSFARVAVLGDLDRARAEGRPARQVRPRTFVPPGPGRGAAGDPRHALAVRALGPVFGSGGASRLHARDRFALPGDRR